MSDQPPMGMSDQDFLSNQPPAPGGMPPSGSNAKARLTPPAIALIVVGVIGCLFGLWNVASSTMNYLNPEAALAAQQQAIDDLQNSELPEAYKEMLSDWLSAPPGPIPIIIGALGVLCSALSILAGVSMLQQKRYGICITGAIAGMLPISGCCCLGVPFGIWAIVVLMNADVKAAFRNRA